MSFCVCACLCLCVVPQKLSATLQTSSEAWLVPGCTLQVHSSHAQPYKWSKRSVCATFLARNTVARSLNTAVRWSSNSLLCVQCTLSVQRAWPTADNRMILNHWLWHRSMYLVQPFPPWMEKDQICRQSYENDHLSGQEFIHIIGLLLFKNLALHNL